MATPKPKPPARKTLPYNQSTAKPPKRAPRPVGPATKYPAGYKPVANRPVPPGYVKKGR